MSLPSVGDVLAAIFASGRQAEPGELVIGPSDQLEAGLGASGSPEVELEISL